MNPYTTWLYEDYFINSWASYPINGPQERDGNGDKRWGGTLDAWKGESNFKTSMSQSSRNWLISCDSVQKCGDTVRFIGKIGYHFLHGENNLWIKYFTIIFTEHPMGPFRHIPGSLPPESNSGFVDLTSTCPSEKMVVLLSLVGLCNIFGKTKTMKKTPRWFLMIARCFLNCPQHFLGILPTPLTMLGTVSSHRCGMWRCSRGAWHQMLEGELRFASKNPWVFFFGKGSNIPITRGVTIFRWLTYKWSFLLKPLVIRSLVVLSPLDVWWVVLAKSVCRTPYQNRFEQFRFMITGSPHEWALQGSTKWICPCSCTRL